MRLKEKIDMLPLDGSSDIFNASPAIARDVHNRSERIVVRIGGDGADVGLRSAGGNAHFFRFPFIGAGGVNGLEENISFPAAALSALAVARGLHFNDQRLIAARDFIMSARGTAERCGSRYKQ